MKVFSRVLLTLILSALALTSLIVSSASAAIQRVAVASGFSEAIFMTVPPGDSTRLIVVNRDGAVQIVKNGVTLARPLIDIADKIERGTGEQGLLGMAFDPQYQTNRYFYLNYTALGTGATVVSRFQTSAADPDSADPATESLVITIAQPFDNHNGGMLAFGPLDGYLYIGMGDGGDAGDPFNYSQDSSTLLGKMLRLDVDTAQGYRIPPDNPFVGLPGWRPEIWGSGLRNPWRFSFDQSNGDLYIADVGQGMWEEVDYQPGSSNGGENYGWHRKEGLHCYDPATDCDVGVTLVDPVVEYSHDSGRCSITGGYVYRGCAISGLQGAYFYADWCTGETWSFTYGPGGVTNLLNRTSEIGPMGTVSFGQDYHGELYMMELGSVLYKIVPDGVPNACPSCCAGTTGDIDMSGGNPNLADLSKLINYFKGLGYVPPCKAEADVDRSGAIGLPDLSKLINYLKNLGFVFPPCP